MEPSFKEERIRKITQLYYSRPEIQKAIYEFCKNREISPRYFEGFGKRPDAFQYIGDIFQLAKKGTTSFHCSEELWEDPLKIVTGMVEEQANQLRIGWDLLIDIDCKWFDYSKLAAKAIIQVLENHGVKNISIKFSGSKGWHILIPWKAFPKELAGIPIKDLFPEVPRKIIDFIRFESEKELKKILPEDFYEQFKNVEIKKGIKCNKCSEIVNEYELTDFFCTKCNSGEQRKLQIGNTIEFQCPNCRNKFDTKNSKPFYECTKCKIDSKENPRNFSKTIETDLYGLMGLDVLLVSPRHLFRTPYSLHEKTALASVVIEKDEIENFELKDASPMEVKIKSFTPDAKEGEATELVIQALDWAKENQISKGEDEKIKGKYANYKPIQLKNLTEQTFPPCVLNILKGLTDGRKRALFILINIFRSVGMEPEELEKKIHDWNKKNSPPIKEGYIKSQLSWSYRKKPIMPPNCKEFYQGIAVCTPDNLCGIIKNPVNYIVKKNFSMNPPKKSDWGKKVGENPNH